MEMHNGRWKRYPAYRDSGVEWIGEVPEGWETWKVTHGFQKLGSGTTPKSDDPQYYNDIIPWVTTSELRETVITDTKSKLSEKAMIDYSSLRIYPPETLLFAMYGATIGRMGILGIPATVNQACCAFTGSKFLDSKFTFYWLWMRRPILIALSVGGGQPNLSQDDLRKIRIPAPSIPEQRAIAAFLDRETGRIDTLIEKKGRQVELLQEKRAAFINHAVTKGLDPDVKMKDSGVEWLSEVPEHWKMLALKRLASLKSGESITAENIDKDGDYPVFGGNGLRGYTTTFTHDGTYALIGRQGALCGNINYAQGQFWASEHAVVVTPIRPVETKWLGELLRAMNLNQYSVSAAQPGLSVEMVSNLSVPQPPLQEQSTISAFLDRETERIDTLTTKVRESISKLREYRTALISAAVTGKLDVREGV